MSKLIAIHWSHRRLRIVAGSPASGGVAIQRAFTVDLPAEKTTEAEIAKEISKALRSNGIQRAQAAVVLDRDCVEIRQFEVPPVPSEELAALVKFQANGQFTSFSDSWALDYVPVKFNLEKQATSVLACAVSPQLLGQIRECLGAANIKIAQMTIRGLAPIQSAIGKSGSEDRVLIQQLGDEVDLTAIENRQVLLTRTVKLASHETDEEFGKQILKEFRRTRASCTHEYAEKIFQQLTLIGNESEQPALFSAFQSLEDAKVNVLDAGQALRWNAASLESIRGSTAEFSPAAFALSDLATKKELTIDLANPRTVSGDDENAGRRKMYLAGGIAAAIAILLFGASWYLLGQQKKQIKNLSTQLSQAKNMNTDAPNGIGQVERIDEWKLADVNVLDELAAISDRLPLGDDAIVDMFSGNHKVPSQEFKIDFTGRLTQSSFSRVIDEKLRQQNYLVDPGGDTPLSDDKFYSWKMEKGLAIALEDREIDTYEVSLPAEENAESNQTPNPKGDSPDVKSTGSSE